MSWMSLMDRASRIRMATVLQATQGPGAAARAIQVINRTRHVLLAVLRLRHHHQSLSPFLPKVSGEAVKAEVVVFQAEAGLSDRATAIPTR
jgi:hypothetical protein